MKIHKEGYATIILILIILLVINGVINYFVSSCCWFTGTFAFISIGFWFFIISFFRNPSRPLTIDNSLVMAPADGKVVVIEETVEAEYFKDKRIQVSIFMSPLNVHVNRYPISGKVVFSKYHPGKYLVAWHPKSSTLNERTTIVVKATSGVEILLRQIAGALARRVVCYSKVGDNAIQGQDLGFIKFGSRVDVYLPVGTKINVELNQVVKGNETILAYLK